jgi:hypothetical protein
VVALAAEIGAEEMWNLVGAHQQACGEYSTSGCILFIYVSCCVKTKFAEGPGARPLSVVWEHCRAPCIRACAGPPHSRPALAGAL